DPPFHLAHGETLACGLPRQRRLLLRLLEGEERAPVPGIEAARVEEVAHLAREAKQAQRVGDGGAVAPDLARDLFLGEAQLLLEAVEGLGLLQRAQLLALDV